MEKKYETFMLSDEPKIIGFPVIYSLPVISLTVFGAVIGQAITLFVIGAILSGLMYKFFGSVGIRYFLSIIYWSLPNYISKIFFRRSSNSANRVYLK